ncbi:MAG: hypothetical protein KDC24_09085 [Saprospiraceae bacterium]|nr:hypothetical protein [Saprospiraceae bacterium]
MQQFTFFRFLKHRSLLCCLVGFLIGTFQLNAQVLLDGGFNARTSGLGNIVSVQSGAYSLGNNIAGLVQLEGMAANAFLSQRYLSKDLNIIGVSFALPTNSGAFSASFRHLGFDLWREQMVALGYARKIGNKLYLGGQIDYYNLDLKEYGQQSNFTFELGLQMEISSSVLIGVHTVNPIRASLTEEDVLPAYLALGLAYQLNESLNLMGEIQQDLNGSTDIKMGLAYRLVEALEAQIGYQSRASQFSFGLEYRSPFKLNLGMAMNYHQVLGFTPSVGIIYKK